MGHIWDIRRARMIANTFTAVQLLDIVYISLARDLIRSNCPLFPGLLELLQEPDFDAEPSFPTTTKEANRRAAARCSPQPCSAGEARVVFDGDV